MESAWRSYASNFAPGSSRRWIGDVGAPWSEKRNWFGFTSFEATRNDVNSRPRRNSVVRDMRPLCLPSSG